MIIGYDGKRAAQNRTGLGNYSRFIIKSVARNFPDEKLRLYVPDIRKAKFLEEIPFFHNIETIYPDQWIWKQLPSAWRVWGITPQISRDKIDIYHGVSNELPLNIDRAKCHTVVTIHDLIMMSHPQLYPAIDRNVYAGKIKRACNIADKIIAVSRFTARQLEERLGVPPKKIEVVYQGCDPLFGIRPEQNAMEEVKKKYNLPDRFILYVGTIEARKNLMLLAQALDIIKKQSKNRHISEDIKVVAVGRPTPYMDEVKTFLKEKDISDRMMFCHNVPYKDLPVFYYLARMFVYPSVIEGFGIPLLEAVTAGLPAIGCVGSCLEEAGGEGSIYVAPDAPSAMADTIVAVWDNSGLRSEMRRSGLLHAARFDEQHLGNELMELYRHL